MALVLKDRVKETTTTTGTGTVTLAGAAAGFQTFGVVGNGNTTYYAIVDNVTGEWEVGTGTYTASGTTLSRTTVLSSSNGGSLVNFAAGSKDVFCTYPSSKSVYLDAADVVAQLSFGAITATSVAMTTGTITTAPTNNTDIVNKEYADAIASGIHFHEAVDLATTAALPAATYNNGTGGVGATLTANANGALSVDSTLTVVGNRILVKNQAAGAQNGVYVVTQVGSGGAPYILTRATDFDSVGTGVDQIDEGDFFLVTSGTANVNTAWVQQTPPPITIGTTAIVFQQFSAPITYTAGTGLSESPTYTFNIANTGTAGTYGSASAVPVFVTNAQGQVTSVTNTAIAINGSAVSGNITGSAGSVANALTLGTYLTGGSFNGSAAVTATVDATTTNTASKVVARDASGNFAAGTITAALSGNATSATNVAGGAANQIVYNTGSGASAFVVAPTTSGQVLNWNGSAFNYVAGTISGVALGSTLNSLTAGTYLTGTAYNGSGAQTWTVDATSANTISKVVARDSSGNFAAGTITAALSGNATTATTAGTITGQANSATITATSTNTINQIVLRDGSGNFSAGTITAALNGNASTATSATTSGSTSGNAATATALQTARNIGGVSFNGTANIDLPGVNTSGNQNTSGNAANVTGVVAIANGGTGQSTRQAAIDALAGAVTAGQYLRGDGVDVVMSAIQAADVPTLNQNTTGTAANVSGTVAVANGGTGATTNTAARTNLGATTLGSNLFTITNPSAVTFPRFNADNTVSSLDAASFRTAIGAGTSSTTGTVTSVSGTGTASGLSLSGTVTTSGNITLSGTVNSLAAGTYGISISGNAATITGQANSATITATNANTGSQIVLRDASGNFSAGTITATLSGNASTATSATSATSATTATTATTANALNTGNNYQVNSLGVGTAASGTAGEIRATNNITAYFSSDIKFKENVRDIPNAADTAKAIGGKLFDWTDAYIAEHGGVDGYFVQKHDFGVIAQDVQKVFPIAVRTRPDGSLAVDYEKLSALALAAVAEQEVRIAKLEALVAKLIEG
jgi:hypothetical protein